jgi:hypothetical protein
MAASALTAGAAVKCEAAIIYSGLIDIPIPATTDGIYLNLHTGATSTTGFAGFDFSPYKNTAGLVFFSPSRAEGTLAESSAPGSPARRLTGSEFIGAGGTYNGGQAPGTAFFSGGSASVGIRFFNEATGMINYGWVRLTTTSGNGFPATIRDYAYENSGAGISTGPLTPPPPFGIINALSRKIHGGVTHFVNLPLSGQPAVECRNTGGNHVLLFQFTQNIASATAEVTSGIAQLAGPPEILNTTVTVALTGVADVQQITVTLRNVTSSSSGAVLPDIPLTVNMLAGDVNTSRAVNATDIAQVKSESGNGVTSSNFRADIDANGAVTASDVGQVKARAGNTLP